MAITPYLYYEDVGEALTFLRKAFDFKKHGRPMRHRGKINHAAMKSGDDVFMLGRPPSDYKNPKRLGQATQSLYVMIDDVDKHFERAKRAGGKIIEQLGNTEYGHRRYGVEDLEGHQWYFASELKGKTKSTQKARRKKKSGARYVNPD